jgi:hypothetical protein
MFPTRISLVLATLLLGAVASPAAAESTQLRAMREQLAQLEQLNQAALAPMVTSIRELIATMEAEEREAASSASSDSSGDTSTITEDGSTGGGRGYSPPSKPAAVPVRKSYFTEAGRPAMERCPKTGQAAIDNICPVAMIRYQNYLAAVGSGDASAQQLYTLHAQTAQVYLAALADFDMDPSSPVLAETAKDAPRQRPAAKDTRDPQVFAEGGAVKTGREPSSPVVSDREKLPPCVKSRPNVSCVSPQ